LNRYIVAVILLNHVDAIVRVALGGAWDASSSSSSSSPSSPVMPLWGEVVRTNANWIMRGGALHVEIKLTHNP
jgi:hypothetical protein